MNVNFYHALIFVQNFHIFILFCIFAEYRRDYF